MGKIKNLNALEIISSTKWAKLRILTHLKFCGINTKLNLDLMNLNEDSKFIDNLTDSFYRINENKKYK